jgi:hypothetical protein
MRFLHMAALAEVEVRVQLDDGRWGKLRACADGKMCHVHVDVDTPDGPVDVWFPAERVVASVVLAR